MLPNDTQVLGSDFFAVSEKWRETFPGAHAGVLAIRVAPNPSVPAVLEQAKRNLEEQLRQRYAGKDRAALRADPILHAYEDYYRQFDKTYHVLLQLESIVFKGKSISNGTPLVKAMFMAEVDSRLLTAGHDLSAIEGPVRLDVSTGNENYILLRGTPQVTKAGDMMIGDHRGVISCVIYGPDQRTQMGPETREALFTVYAPMGVSREAIQSHLEKIREYASLVVPSLATLLLQIYPLD